MPWDAAPGSVSDEQLRDLQAHADRLGCSRRHLNGLLMDQRNRTNRALEDERRTPHPLLAHVQDASHREVADLLEEMAAIADGGRARDVCLRCARLGWPYAGRCLHDRGESDRASQIAERERSRGLLSW